MKHLLWIVVCCYATTLNLWAQGAAAVKHGGSQGIEFFHGTWEQVKQEAKKQNKAIFVDAYASWCGPCKRMANEVFTDPAVGSFYNKNFINFKVDMQTGEGPALDAIWGVEAFPTLIFFDSKGEMVSKTKGYQNSMTFLTLGKRGLYSPAKMAEMEQKYISGERKPEFLMEYVEVLKLQNKDATTVVNEYIATQNDSSDWLKEENMVFAYTNTQNVESPLLWKMLQNLPAYSERFGETWIAGKTNIAVAYSLKAASERGDDALVGRCKEAIKVLGRTDADMLGMRIDLEYYRLTKRWDDFLRTAATEMDKYDLRDAEFLNSIAWIVYENTDQTAYLEKALNWAKRSVTFNSTYNNNDTMAAILYKLKRKQEALVYAQKAVEIAQSQGKYHQNTLDLIKKIEQLP